MKQGFVRQKSGRSKVIGVFLLLTLSILCGEIHPVIADNVDRAAKIKAAFIYYACNYVPTATDSAKLQESIKVCSIGKDEVSSELEDILAKKKIRDKTAVSITFDEKAIDRKDPSIGDCDIAYITQGAANLKWPNELGLRPNILTISEYPQFLSEGGIIKMYVESNRIKFEVNIRNAEDAGVRISAEFLALAGKVIREK